MFPEGTDLSPDNIIRSNIYAKKNNLPNYQHVLHPKTTGFVFLVDTMRKSKINYILIFSKCIVTDVLHFCLDNQINAVYDLTVGYPDLIPQSEMDALRGVFPKRVHFHIKR